MILNFDAVANDLFPLYFLFCLWKIHQLNNPISEGDSP
jgi:hypothetical protein